MFSPAILILLPYNRKSLFENMDGSQQGKVLATSPSDLSLIPGTYTVGGKKGFFDGCLQMYLYTHARTYTTHAHLHYTHI